MQYTLMHKNHRVMELTISQDCTQIMHVGKIYDAEHIPVGLRIPLRKSVNHWWRRRAIPASRSGLSQALLSLHLNAPEELLTKCYGLSLSDQYWVKPVDAENFPVFLLSQSRGIVREAAREGVKALCFQELLS